MRILVVIGSQINGFPPVRNLIEILLRNQHQVTVIAKDRTGLYITQKGKYRSIVIPEASEGTPKVIAYQKKCQFMRAMVRKEMKRHDILWTATDATVRDLGDVVLDYKHVMQLMELIRDIPRIPGMPYPPLNIKRYAKAAFKVVVPEYNRAHIQKTWWNLKKTPEILPNKMTLPVFENIEVPDNVDNYLKRIKADSRKMILYQGVFHEDRDLVPFLEAARQVKQEYYVCMMGTDTDYRVKLSKEYPDTMYIPFIKPPFHLMITMHAHIGLLPYKPEKYLHYDIINALYCAPNKIFEYAGFGVPMIGTDVPGLYSPFVSHQIGFVCQPFSVERIIENIYAIENNYQTMSDNCKDYYESINMDAIVESILQS